MRRNLAVVAAMAAVLGGCSVFSAHTNEAASAAGQEFTSQQMAALMTAGKGVPLTTQTAQIVADIWVDLTVFSQAVADNSFKPDSAQIAAGDVPPDRVRQGAQPQGLAGLDPGRRHPGGDRQRLEGRQAARHPAHPHQGRFVGHARPRRRPRGRRSIRSSPCCSTAPISASVAHANSEDIGSVPDSGMMPPVPENFFVPSFSKVAWSLKPGEMSGVVTTEFGYHIIRRPTEVEATRMWRQALAQDKFQRLGDSLVQAVHERAGQAARPQGRPRRHPAAPRRAGRSRRQAQRQVGAGQLRRRHVHGGRLRPLADRGPAQSRPGPADAGPDARARPTASCRR